MGNCKSGDYKEYFYDDNTFASLQPERIHDCLTDSGKLTPAPTILSDIIDNKKIRSRGVLAGITMIAGLLLLMFIMYRSTNRYKTDWYRLIGVYLLGTISVPISLFIGPSNPGFNRIIGFGILIHNLAEVFILGHIWFGDINSNLKKRNRYGGIIAIAYIYIIMVFITFLPGAPLFFILMLQGASLDYTLVATFISLYIFSKNNIDNKDDNFNYYCACFFGILAPIWHIISIEPLFFGISTTLNWLNGLTVVLLLPTFIFYILFAACDIHHSPIITAPNKSSNVCLNYERNNLLKELVIKNNINNNNNDIELKERTNINSDNYNNNNNNNNNNENDNKSKENENELEYDKDKKYNIYGNVINLGFVNINEHGWRTFAICVSIGITLSTINSVIVYFWPCWFDLVNTVCYS